MNCMRFDAEDNNGIYSHPSVVFEVWFYTLLGAFFLFVGFSLSHYAFGKVINIKQVHHSFDYKDLTIKSYDVSNKNFRWILCLYFLSVIVLFLYRSQIGEFPLESIFLGLKGSDLALLRSDATNNFSGKLYRYVIFMEVLPIFLFVLVSLIKRDNISKKWNILYILLLFHNVLYTLITLQKGPIIKFILLCYIIYSFKERKMEKKPLVLVSLVSVVLIVLMYIFFMGRSDETPVSEILGGALHRIFISSIMPFYWYIMYTNEHGLLLGTSFPNPAGIFPFEHFRLSVEIMNYARGFDDGVVGSMPTVFIGEMYSNFGFLGIIISAVFWGFFLQTIDLFFWNKGKRGKGISLSALYICLMIFFQKHSVSGISGLIFDTNFYAYILLAIWYHHRELKYQRKIRKI